MYELKPEHDVDAKKIFETVDTNLDVQAQMRLDPTGGLTLFWAEQRRRLHVDKRSRWNPMVLRYCFYLWLRVGNSKFEAMRDVLILPSKRTLQLLKSSIPSGDGFQSQVYEELAELWSCEARDKRDWECLLSWDATGYAKNLKFNKHTGCLTGFGCSPESFSTECLFSNRVNCFMVSSPNQHIDIQFPVSYYHYATLTSADILEQFRSTMHGLHAAGFKVVGLVCDGASEHGKMFELILDQVASADETIKIRM